MAGDVLSTGGDLGMALTTGQHVQARSRCTRWPTIRTASPAPARLRFVFLVTTLPALRLILPFRVPREWIEDALLPV